MLGAWEDLVPKGDAFWVKSVGQVLWDLRGTEPPFHTWSSGSRKAEAMEKTYLFL